MLIKLSLKSIRKTFDRLPIFFLSVSFAIMVAFIFQKIGTNDSFIKRLNGYQSVGYEAAAWLVLASGFISFSLALFILYSNNFFMKRRRKDISIFLVSGFSRMQVGLFYLIQQFILGALLFIVGNLLGVIFTRLFLMLLLKLMSFPLAPIIKISLADFNSSIIIFGIILSLVWINTLYHVFQTKTNFSMQHTDHHYGQNKPNFIREILGLISVFVLALDIVFVAFKLPNSLWIGDGELFLSFILVVVGGPLGLYGLFKWFLPNLFRQLKKFAFISDQQLIWMSNVGNTFHKSSFVLTAISVISILALAIFTLLSFAYPFRQEAVRINSPSILAINSDSQNLIEKIAQKNDYILEPEIKVPSKIVSSKNDFWTFIPLSSYNQYWDKVDSRHKKIKLLQNEAVLLTDRKYSQVNAQNPTKFLNDTKLINQIPKLKLKRKLNTFPMGRLMYVGDAIVVTDSVFNKIKGFYQYDLLSYQIEEKGFSAKEELPLSKFSNELNNLLIDGSFDNSFYLKRNADLVTVSDKYIPDFQERMLKINYSGASNVLFKQVLGLVVFTLLFLAILLILSSGNLLILRLQNDLFENLQDFIIYRKLGATKKELLHILRNQTMLIFFAPMLVSILTIISFLPLISIIFNTLAFFIFGSVIIAYIILNMIFYVVAYHDFSTLINTSILERKAN